MGFQHYIYALTQALTIPVFSRTNEYRLSIIFILLLLQDKNKSLVIFSADIYEMTFHISFSHSHSLNQH